MHRRAATAVMALEQTQRDLAAAEERAERAERLLEVESRRYSEVRAELHALRAYVARQDAQKAEVPAGAPDAVAGPSSAANSVLDAGERAELQVSDDHYHDLAELSRPGMTH